MPYGILYLAAYSRTRGQRRYRARRQCVPQPEAIPTTDIIMMIGSPAYIVDGDMTSLSLVMILVELVHLQ